MLFQEMSLSGWETVLTDLASDLNVGENKNCMEVLEWVAQIKKFARCSSMYVHSRLYRQNFEKVWIQSLQAARNHNFRLWVHRSTLAIHQRKVSKSVNFGRITSLPEREKVNIRQNKNQKILKVIIFTNFSKKNFHQSMLGGKRHSKF